MEYVEKLLTIQGSFQVEQQIEFFRSNEHDWAIVIAESQESANKFRDQAHGKEIQFNDKDPVVEVQVLLWTDKEFSKQSG